MRIAVKLKYFLLIGLALMLLLPATSCEDLIGVDKPKTQLIRAAVFENDDTAISAVLGLYTRITSQQGMSSITHLAALSADELLIGQEANDPIQFYENEILSINITIEQKWSDAYNTIYTANSILEGLQNSEKITASLKDQLIGEAKFFRAFYHFYLVNLFGDVPYIATTDYRVNALVHRAAVSDVYDRITADLLEAKTLLSEDYSLSGGERIRVNKWVAASLLARVYLYQQDWIHAEEQATTVINETSLYNLLDSGKLDKVFLTNSRETIWQLVPANNLNYTAEGSFFNRDVYSPSVGSLTEELFNSFEVGDDRKGAWVGNGNDGTNVWHYPLKYKETSSDTLGPDEYYTVFRLAEQFLIRAEARAKQNKLTGANSAESDINIIRDRAGLIPTTAVSEAEILAAIAQERRVELFVEWGHRWLDLKRTEKATAVLSPIKTSWDDTDVLYPIPYSELQLNPNMTQNDGY